MGSIRQRNGKYQAQVRRQGSKPLSRTFKTKKHAQVWLRGVESQLDMGEVNPSLPKGLTLGDLIDRYRSEITPLKKGKEPESRRLKRLLGDTISTIKLADLTSARLANFRDRRIKDGVRAAQYDLILIRHAIEIARKEWGVGINSNPVNNVRIPNGIRRRERRIQAGEWSLLYTASRQCRNPYTWPLVQFAVATAMRRGEMLALTWANTNLYDRLLFLPNTKNGTSRSIPLTHEAVAILAKLNTFTINVFPQSDYAARHSWDRLVKRAGIADLRFHDLRHEAISRLFEMGLSMPEVALISGHKDPRMLFRYTHLRANDILKTSAFNQDYPPNIAQADGGVGL